MSFSGFSEDDIKKISTGNKLEKALTSTPTKKVTFKIGKKSKEKIKSTNPDKDVISELPETAKLNPIVEVAANGKAASNDKVVADNKEATPLNGNIPCVENRQDIGKKFIDLDEFEARQKIVEEQNRKRKEQLAKALADRTKRTQEEAQRLNGIQGEFKLLDEVLWNDVKILRKQVEVASFEYNECQKKYIKAEKEFLDAKLALHQKQERKEMLTEHLCTIIEKNEERKAEKLNELLKKLEMNNSEEIATSETKCIANT